MKEILMSTTLSAVNKNESAIVIAITGDTYYVKDAIKALGYKFDDREWFKVLNPADYATKEAAAAEVFKMYKELEASVEGTKVIFDTKYISKEIMKHYS